MLVVLSDLHLADGTAGKHNLSHQAFEEILLSNVATAARKNEALDLRLVLDGDIIDLIRMDAGISKCKVHASHRAISTGRGSSNMIGIA